MAKKQNFTAETVTAPSYADMVGNAASGTGVLGNKIIGQNIAGGRQSFAEGAQMLQTGGALAMNPVLQQLYDAQLSPLIAAGKQDGKQLTRLNSQLTKLQAQRQKAKTPKQQASLDAKIEALTTQIGTVNTRLTETVNKASGLPQQIASGQPNFVDLIRDTNKEMYGQLDRAQTFADQMGQATDAGRRLMDTAGRGYSSGQIGATNVTAQQAEAGMLGDTLMGRAQTMAQSTGQLSPEAARDAVQSARQAFSARGLGTSMGSAAAELLNRDRFSRQRMFEDMTFAQNINQKDVDRRLTNAEMANRVGLANQDASLRGQIANEEARRLGTQLNMGMLGDAVNYEQGLQSRGLGASLQMAEVRGSTNPYNTMIGFDPFGGRTSGSQAVGPASQLSAEQARLGLDASMFNANATNWQNALNKYGNYGGQQSGMGAAMGGLGGMALGAGVGALLAAPTGGMSIPMGMALGSSVGGGVGAGVGGLFGR